MNLVTNTAKYLLKKIGFLNKKIVIGVSRTHDVSVAIFMDGELIYFAEAERVLNIKHARWRDKLEPTILEACRQAGISIKDIDAVCIADSYDERLEDSFPESLQKVHSHFPIENLGNSEQIKYLPNHGIDLDFDIATTFHWTCHHAAHALSALYMAGYDEAAILVADGYGPCCGTAAYHYKDGKLIPIQQLNNFALLGIRYQLFGYLAKEIDSIKTDGLDMAGKVMGLNAYGTQNESWVQYFINWFKDSDFDRYISCENVDNVFFDDLIEGGITVDSMSVTDPNFLNMIASMQEAFTRVMVEMCEKTLSATGSNRLIVTGGCALNVLANTRISHLSKEVFFQPPAGDGGLSIGAATIISSIINKTPLHHPNVNLAARRNPYLGIGLLDEGEDDSLLYPSLQKIPLEIEFKETAQIIARNIASEKIVGLISGRSEMGPRALGNRSILAYAASSKMRDLINQKIKHREWWRPFAPVCRSVDVEEYFDSVVNSPYMLTTSKVKNEYLEILSSACHDDGTARLQTLPNREWNPLLWDILGALKEITGVGVAINTSFNDSGKPLVNSKKEALNLFLSTQMDLVWIDGILYSKNKIT